MSVRPSVRLSACTSVSISGCEVRLHGTGRKPQSPQIAANASLSRRMSHWPTRRRAQLPHRLSCTPEAILSATRYFKKLAAKCCWASRWNSLCDSVHDDRRGTNSKYKRSSAQVANYYLQIRHLKLSDLTRLYQLSILTWLRCPVVKRRRTFPVPRSTCSWRVTTYVGKQSAIGQPIRPTQRRRTPEPVSVAGLHILRGCRRSSPSLIMSWAAVHVKSSWDMSPSKWRGIGVVTRAAGWPCCLLVFC